MTHDRPHPMNVLAPLLAVLVLAACVPVASAVAAAAAPAAAPAAPPAVDETASQVTLDEVLVTGERPGPGMWRVSKADHDLWILATLEPLPKKMIWRSEAVEERIAASQVVLAAPTVEPDIGFFRGLTLLPALLRARKNPDGETLEQAVPHALYMRWLALRVKYLGRSDDEHMRPTLAALDLYLKALDEAGLTGDESVWRAVEQTARKHRVTVQPVTLKLHIDDPKGVIRELDHVPPAAELACLEKTIDRLETDLQPMRQRANLWSLGDVEGLRAMPYPDEAVACFNTVANLPKLHDQFTRAESQLIDAWLSAAQGALEKNVSSFAVLPINELLKPDGWLAKLRDQGYHVTEP